MFDDLWIEAISKVTANSSSLADEVPLSFVHREGLGQQFRNSAEESQNLRLLRLSVQGLEAWTLTLEQYEENVIEVMEVAEIAWKEVQKLPGEAALKGPVARGFQQLYQACELMLEEPYEGLERAVEAFKALETSSRQMQTVIEEETPNDAIAA